MRNYTYRFIPAFITKTHCIYRYVLFLGFLFFTLSATAQSKSPVNKKYVDSVISTLDTIPDHFKKIEKLVRTAGNNRYTKPTRALIDKAISISKIVDDPKLFGHSYYSLGNYYYFNSKIDSCLSALDKAYQYSEGINEPLLKASILTTKGGAYQNLGAVILAISTTIEAKNMLDKVDTSTLTKEEQRKYKGQNLVLNNSLANLYTKTEDFDKAVEFYDKAYDAAIGLGSQGNAAVILGNKGFLLITNDKLEEGLTILEAAKEMKVNAGLPERFIASTDLSIGLAYFKMKKYDLAKEYYEKSLAVYKAINSEKGMMEGYTMLGELNNAENNLLAAEELCNKGKAIAVKINDSDYLMKSCNCLYEAHNKLGNYKASLTNHELFTKVKDSVFNEKNIRKITQVGMQYEFDKIEAEQQAIIDQKNRQTNRILFVLFTLGVFLLLIILFFRKRIKYQKTIAAQNYELQRQKIIELQQKNKLASLNSMIEGQEVERLRIAKDLHDSLGGLLSTVKAHFKTIQNKNEALKLQEIAQKTDQLIDEACIEVRRISHNMMPHALSISGLKGAIEDMGDRLVQQGYTANVEIQNLPSKIDTTKEVMIYRLIQEINSNIRKHAEATSILIQLIGHEKEITLIVEDDGKGFDYKEAEAKGGLGLKSINSRVQFLDGTIDWDTAPGRGTTLTINIPTI